MKYNLVVRYAGYELVFKNLEHDDEDLVDESYLPRQIQCVDENNGRMVENFFENVVLEIDRHALA
jgi:hypothetical protein